jgi:hypothetical protein
MSGEDERLFSRRIRVQRSKEQAVIVMTPPMFVEMIDYEAR